MLKLGGNCMILKSVCKWEANCDSQQLQVEREKINVWGQIFAFANGNSNTV